MKRARALTAVETGLRVGDPAGHGFTVAVVTERSVGGHPYMEARRRVPGAGTAVVTGTSEEGLRANAADWERRQLSRKDGGLLRRGRTKIRVVDGTVEPDPEPEPDPDEVAA